MLQFQNKPQHAAPSQAFAESITPLKKKPEHHGRMVDHRSETVAQRKLQASINPTGLPDTLKAGVEADQIGMQNMPIQRVKRQYLGEDSWSDRSFRWKPGAEQKWNRLEYLAERVNAYGDFDPKLTARREKYEKHSIGFSEADLYIKLYEYLFVDLFVSDLIDDVDVQKANDAQKTKDIVIVKRAYSRIEQEDKGDNLYTRLIVRAKNEQRFLDVIKRPLDPEVRSFARPLAGLLGIEVPASITPTTNALDQMSEKVTQDPNIEGCPSVDQLFEKFMKHGFQYDSRKYDLGEFFGIPGEEYEPETYLVGNCENMSDGFVELLKQYGYEASTEYVHREGQAPIILKLPHFIDSKIKGNIKIDGAISDYYLFSMHTAAFVNAKGKYYDPMAGEIYTDFQSKRSADFQIQEIGARGSNIKCTYKGQSGSLHQLKEDIMLGLTNWELVLDQNE